MPRIVKAAFAYTLPVFAVAFVLGAIRVTMVAPALGPLAAVAHGTNALARFLYDQMPGQPGPMTPPAPVQKPDGSWGW